MRGGRDGRGERVGEQVRPGPLPQHLDDLFAGGGVAAARAAEGLAQRAGHDVDPILDAEQFRRAGAGRPDESDGVGVVHHDQRSIALGELDDRVAAARRNRPWRRRRRWRSAGAAHPPTRAVALRGRPCRCWRSATECALQSRTPSMMLAWFSSSEMMASSGPSRVSKSPPLASKQEEYKIASSVPRKCASRLSSSLWISAVPQMKRTDAIPNPQRSRPAELPAIMAG